MATRSTIAIEFADGTVQQVYCHWDGYLENNGALLLEHYMDPFKVRELVDLGAFSSLRETVAETAESKYGEDAHRYMNTDEYFDCCQQEEYDYLMRNLNGKATWFVRCYATENQWVTINDAAELMFKMNEEKVY